MNKEYIQQYVWLEKEHWWFVVRQQIILYFLRKRVSGNRLKILNIGAAGGASSKWLGEFGEVLSLESDPLFLEHLQKTGVPATQALVESMPFEDNQFDLVCAFDVIEHVREDALALKEMQRVCKIGGIICLTVPAFQQLWSQHDFVNQHFRRYTKATLLKAVRAATSLRVLETKYFNAVLFAPIFIARKFSNLLGNKGTKQSDFTRFKSAGPTNCILKAIFRSELFLLPRINFPFGVSLVCLLQKTTEQQQPG